MEDPFRFWVACWTRAKRRASSKRSVSINTIIRANRRAAILACLGFPKLWNRKPMKAMGVFLAAALGACSLSASAGIAWSLVKSQEGRYAVSMPGTVADMQIPIKAKQYKLMLKYKVSQGDDEVLYLVGYVDLPKDNVIASTPDAILDWFRVAAATKDGMTLLGQRSIDLKGVPGRELTWRQKDKSLCLGRIYLNNNRLYLTSLNIADGKPVPADLDRFFSSFRML